MKQDTWLRCHINMYRFFGGVSICTVCDNLKTGVIAHPKDGDIVLNEAYEALASHYQTVVMPTAVRKPKFKASVEGSVGLVTTTVIARLRNEVFHSFDTLKAHVTACVHDLNRKPFQKRPFSRIEAFQEEKEYLQPLPSIEYEIANWVYKRKVGLNYHVNFKKNLYSCPYQYLGQYADLRVTDQTVEIYIGHQRVATHNRIPDYRTYKYATNEEHMPEQFKHAQWDAERILNWASKIGPSTQLVIECIFNSVSIKEQGYNPSLSVLRLSKKYSNQRLEVASKIALTQIQSPRYRHLNAILTANQDRIHMDQSHQSKPTNAEEGYVRGAHYYGGNKK